MKIDQCAFPTLEDYLRADRQWRRSERIANAEYQLRVKNPPSSYFWEMVLEALGADDYRTGNTGARSWDKTW